LPRRSGEGARGGADMRGHQLVLVVHPDEPSIPADVDSCAQQVSRDGIEGAGDLDMAVRVDRAGAALEERKRLRGQRPNAGRSVAR
jgi:hypothetical protein